MVHVLEGDMRLLEIFNHCRCSSEIYTYILSQSQCAFGAKMPGRIAQSVGHLTHKSGVLGLIPGLAAYFRFSFRFFKKGSCQLLAKVCA